MDTFNWLRDTAKAASYRLMTLALRPEAEPLLITAEAPVWLLGEAYRAPGADPSAEALAHLLRDVRSRIWLSYRSGFPQIEGSSLSSDAGWGCMARTGQMMLAQALIILRSGRGWRTGAIKAASEQKPREGDASEGNAAPTEGEATPAAAEEDAETRRTRERQLQDELGVVGLFADVPEAPFSIQRIARAGVAQGTPVGTWFGPTPISQVLSQLSQLPAAAESGAGDTAPPAAEAEAAPSDAPTDESTAGGPAAAPDIGLSVHVAMDGSLYREQVREAARQPDGSWRPVLVLLPLRLGLQTLNPAYSPCLCALFELRQSVGVIGGAPRRSFYFVGCQEKAAAGPQLLYLDPHEVQPALSVPLAAERLSSCHRSDTPRTMPVAQIDPSLALGFLCATSADFDDLCASCSAIFGRTLAAFSIGERPPPFHLSGGDAEGEGADEDEDLVVV